MAFGGRSGNRSFSLSHTVTVAAGERLRITSSPAAAAKSNFALPALFCLPFSPFQILYSLCAKYDDDVFFLFFFIKH